MQDTFSCDRCSEDFPVRQLKEAFSDEGDGRHKENLCPNCLDIRMTETDQVKGVAGEEKRAAVRLEDGPVTGASSSEGFGEREQSALDLGDESQSERADAARRENEDL